MQKNNVPIMLAAVCLALFLSGALAVRPAYAVGLDRYVAKTGSDSGNCSSDPCLTIGYAITESGSNDVIHIGAGTYTENLVTNKNLNFLGTGMQTTILDGGGVGTVITGDTYNLFIQDLTIRNGYALESGGGINESGGVLNLSRVWVTGNVAKNGGGIVSSGPLTMNDCVVSDNQANLDTNGDGGGLFLQGGAVVTVNITNVTFSGNTASLYSGGIHNQGLGTLNLTNVTISGNTAKLNGAMTNTNHATANILNITIAWNHSSAAGGNGGIGNYATVYFKNSLLSGNDTENCGNGTGGVMISLGNNLESGNNCNFTQTSDLPNTDPQLGSLADNGGPTQTLALLDASVLHPRSPAIDAGADTGCPPTDQRGVARPQGAHCDIGAFELMIARIYLPLIWH
jgi:hypothetical protein